MWEVEFTDEFSDWWKSLNEDEQESLTVSVNLLTVLGPSLGRPHADAVKRSKHSNMRRNLGPSAMGSRSEHSMPLTRVEKPYY